MAKYITDPTFNYIPSVNTNITARFEEMGWIAPSKMKDALPEDMNDAEYITYVLKKCREFIEQKHGAIDQVEMLTIAIGRVQEIA